MAEQDNSLRTTSASKKRPFDYVDKSNQSLRQIPLTKKRIASSDNAQKCSYTPLIYQHLHSLEVEEKRRPLADYMETVQKDVNPAMRDILLDWLVEVTEEYKLVSDTLYLTVSYIDRFLSQHAVSRKKLQLLGVSCMLVASLILTVMAHGKYEEISLPCVEDFCFITDNTFTKEEVVDMEQQILEFLNFNMGIPTIKTFMRYFIKAAEENCMVGLPLDVVNEYNLVPRYYSGYRPSELKECVLAIHDLQLSRRGISLRAEREKYMEHKVILFCLGTSIFRALVKPGDLTSLMEEL